MKALSIRQPWAWLILEAPEAWRKPVENRTWFTKHRGNLLIHAAKGCTQAEHDAAVAFVRGFNQSLAAAIPALENLPRGGIVGMVKITDCVKKHSSPFFVGPWGWVMTNPYPITFRAMIGMPGIFNVNKFGLAEEIR